MLVYVDDIVLTGNNSKFLDQIVEQLGATFSIRDLGQLSYFLGVQVACNSDGLQLSQEQYINNLLDKAGMRTCKPLHTLMATIVKLFKNDSPAFSDPTLYRHVVGALQYLTLTRPDIDFVVKKVCQFMQSPSQNQWIAVKRVLHYLQHTKKLSFFISRSCSLHLQAF